MKKMVIVLIIAVIAMIVLNFVLLFSWNRSNRDVNDLNNTIDTTINRYRIDSIELVIHTKDSVIYNIKHKADEEVFESLSDDDSAAVRRFIELCQ